MWELLKQKKLVFRLLGGFFFSFSLFAPSANAEVESLSILQTENVACGDNQCVKVQGKLNGQAPGGEFSAPFTLMYPQDPATRNGVAIVDVANSMFQTLTFYDTIESNPEFFPVHYMGQIVLGDKFIGNSGYIHMAVHWDKFSMAICGEMGHPECSGFMGQDTDGYWIVQYAGDFIKSSHPQLLALLGTSPQKSIATGFSQSGYLLQQILKNENMDMNFDGILLGGVDMTCAKIYDGIGWNFEYNCDGMMPPNVGKTIVCNPETDVESGGWTIRGDTDWYKVYEIPGTVHASLPIADLSSYGATRQNPTDPRPYLRGCIDNLRAWIMEDKEPNPSTYLNLASFEPEFYDLFPHLGLGEIPIWPLEREEGCAKGGVPVPHCTRMDGSLKNGAPLGNYTGTEFNVIFDPDNNLLFRSMLIVVGGTFDPMVPEELKVPYNNPGSYVSRVSRAAQKAYEDGWILLEDAEAYSRAAAHCPVGSKGFNPATPEDLRSALVDCHRL